MGSKTTQLATAETIQVSDEGRNFDAAFAVTCHADGKETVLCETDLWLEAYSVARKALSEPKAAKYVKIWERDTFVSFCGLFGVAHFVEQKMLSLIADNRNWMTKMEDAQ